MGRLCQNICQRVTLSVALLFPHEKIFPVRTFELDRRNFFR